MSKYKVGDRLNLQIVVDDIGKKDNLGFWVTTNRYNEEDGMWLTEEQLDKYSAKTYEQGLEDAWKLARKISDIPTTQERADIFGFVRCGITVGDILRNMDCQEALAKLETYEKEQEIKVGDVVECLQLIENDWQDDCYGVVTSIYNDSHYEILMQNGDGVQFGRKELKKTGKHIDIQNILEQIKED